MSPKVEKQLQTKCRECGNITSFTINGLCLVCYGLVDEQDYLTVHLDK
ncbi:hypothetical protein SDC9_07450 [bioreactor metagenome]|uniref:Uncharacterized protein n=1 Tax=bioreactor metagenome TaxID=1076179 RepID=A0A644T7G8_9ZZZZ|nr:hypothetical protein [Methanobrevibacter sp.]MEA4956906.1 hypothetical protein [Methanobrevibacter sp.]